MADCLYFNLKKVKDMQPTNIVETPTHPFESHYVSDQILEHLPLEIINRIFLFGENLYAYSLLNRHFNDLSKSIFKLNDLNPNMRFYLDKICQEVLTKKNTKQSQSLVLQVGLKNLQEITNEHLMKKVAKILLILDKMDYLILLSKERIHIKIPVSDQQIQLSIPSHVNYLNYILEYSLVSDSKINSIVQTALKEDLLPVFQKWVTLEEGRDSEKTLKSILHLVQGPQCLLFILKKLENRIDYPSILDLAIQKNLDEVVDYLIDLKPHLIKDVYKFLESASQKNFASAFKKVYQSHHLTWSDQNYVFLKKAFSYQWIYSTETDRLIRMDEIVDFLLDNHPQDVCLENFLPFTPEEIFMLLRYSMRNAGSGSEGLKKFKKKVFLSSLNKVKKTSKMILEGLKLAIYFNNLKAFKILINLCEEDLLKNVLKEAILQGKHKFVILTAHHPKFPEISGFYILEAIKTKDSEMVRLLLKIVTLQTYQKEEFIHADAIQLSLVDQHMIEKYCPYLNSAKYEKGLFIKNIIDKGLTDLVELFLVEPLPREEINDLIRLAIVKNSSLILEKIIHFYSSSPRFEITLPHVLLAVNKKNPYTFKILLEHYTFKPEETMRRAYMNKSYGNFELSDPLQIMNAACAKLHPDILKEILKNPRKVPYIGECGHTIIDYAIKRNDSKLLKLLFHHGYFDLKSNSKYLFEKVYEKHNDDLSSLLLSQPGFCLHAVIFDLNHLQLKYLFKIYQKITTLSPNEIILDSIFVPSFEKMANLVKQKYEYSNVYYFNEIIQIHTPYFITHFNSLINFTSFKEIITLKNLHALTKNRFYSTTNDFEYEIGFQNILTSTPADIVAFSYPLDVPEIKTKKSAHKALTFLKTKNPGTLNTIFKWSLQHNYLHLIKIILKNFKDELNLENLEELALYQAVYKDNKRLLKLLIHSSNIDFCFKDNFIIRFTGLKGNLSLLKFIYQNHREAFKKEASTLFQIACSHGYMDILKFLYEKQQKKKLAFDPNADDNDALKKACMYGHTEVVKFLLAHYEVNPRAEGNIALRFAHTYGFLEIIQILSNHS